MTTGGMPDMGALLAQAMQMQQQIADVQAQLAAAHVTGSSGGGMVRATVTGGGELVGLEIDPSVVDPDDTETLADLVLAAVRDAHRAAADMQQQAMSPFAAAMGGMSGMVESMGLDAGAFGLGASGGLGGLPPGSR